MLADPRSEALAQRFAGQWLRLRDVEEILPDALLYPYFDRTLGRAMMRETRAVLRQPGARGPQPARPAHRRLHLRQRAAGQALRHPQHHRHRVPAGDRARLPPRHPRPRQRAGADLGRRSHLAGDARQVGDGGAARLAAAAPAAQRPGARGDRRRHQRPHPHRARADGRAPQEPGVHVVPPGDRPARPDARELRRHRPVAHQGQRPPGGLERRALRRHADGRAGRAARRADQEQGPVPAQLHREPDDLRARPAARRHRHAGGAPGHPRRRRAATTGCRRSCWPWPRAPRSR